MWILARRTSLEIGRRKAGVWRREFGPGSRVRWTGLISEKWRSGDSPWPWVTHGRTSFLRWRQKRRRTMSRVPSETGT